jgi:CheY-like chemotaxis protein
MRTDRSALQIFIAEDSIGDVLLVKEAMAAYGLTAELQLCKDGEAAVSDLGQRDAGNLPDLLIIDLNLPRVDGMEVLRYVRGLPLFDRTPILVFTSSHSANDRSEAERFGANAYVSKPPTLDDFLSTVGSAIHNLIGGSGAHENHSEGTLHGWPGKRPAGLAYRHLPLRLRGPMNKPSHRLLARRVSPSCRPLTLFKTYSRDRASSLPCPRCLIRMTMSVGIDMSEFRAKKENLR